MTKYDSLMGRRCKFTQIFKRRIVDSGTRKWIPILQNGDGWIVGFRTIFSGKFDFISEDEGCVFIQEEPHKCILVSKTPYQNPLRVPLNSYEIIMEA